jgi:hypothetical protein
VRPLVALLREHGVRVWFDEAELEVGDILTESIDDGLARSRFGVVVLSPAFFAKRWPRAELDALANRELQTGERTVLPLWLEVGEEDVRQYSPLLAGKLALRADDGLDAIARRLATRVRQRRRVRSRTSTAVTRKRSPVKLGTDPGTAPFGYLENVLWPDLATRTANFRGWVVDPLDVNAPVEVVVMLDDVPLVATLANRPRQDVAREFGVASEHGFLVQAHVPRAGRFSIKARTSRGEFPIPSRGEFAAPPDVFAPRG